MFLLFFEEKLLVFCKPCKRLLENCHRRQANLSVLPTVRYIFDCLYLDNTYSGSFRAHLSSLLDLAPIQSHSLFQIHCFLQTEYQLTVKSLFHLHRLTNEYRKALIFRGPYISRILRINVHSRN